WRVGHGADGRGAHGADIFVWLLQVSARDELDDRRAASRIQYRDGIYRAIVTLGPNRHLVCRRRRGTGRARAMDRRFSSAIYSRRHDDWRRHVYAAVRPPLP